MIGKLFYGGIWVSLERKLSTKVMVYFVSNEKIGV